MQLKPITPCLWFDHQAEQAAQLYTSIFPNSTIGSIARYGDSGHGTPGSVMTVEFEINGQPFLALNGGPIFPHTEAVSFIVYCETQQELDHYWDKLREGGGQEVQCGWLKDRFGVSWQITPTALTRLMKGDAARGERVMKAVLGMVKLDIAALEAAANQA